VSWIARRSQADKSSELFLYTQAAKLVEEVGELHAQLLGRSKLQRQGKAQEFSQACLEDEFADVLICVVILAQVAGVDLGRAMLTKMDAVEARVAAERLTDTG
jgi:NTP pyrophosphatase (non-canonical NTP hydrolase)